MSKHRDHLRGPDGHAACKQAGAFRTVDFVDFSDSIRMGWACSRCLAIWKDVKAARAENVTNQK